MHHRILCIQNMCAITVLSLFLSMPEQSRWLANRSPVHITIPYIHWIYREGLLAQACYPQPLPPYDYLVVCRGNFVGEVTKLYFPVISDTPLAALLIARRESLHGHFLHAIIPVDDQVIAQRQGWGQPYNKSLVLNQIFIRFCIHGWYRRSHHVGGESQHQLWYIVVFYTPVTTMFYREDIISLRAVISVLGQKGRIHNVRHLQLVEIYIPSMN